MAEDLGLFMILKPRSDKSVADIANHQVVVLEDGRCGREVEVIHLGNGQTEIDQLVIAAVETGKNGIMLVNPSLDIIHYVEVHHTGTTN